MTYSEMESRINSIARRASWFKIGKSGQDKFARMSQHGAYRIEVITYAKRAKDIEEYEERMIDIFINRHNCKNKKGGSAGKMSRSTNYVYPYILYVTYALKRK